MFWTNLETAAFGLRIPLTMKPKKAGARTLTPEQALALAAPSPARAGGTTKIVIVGGGFAGVYTAKYLT